MVRAERGARIGRHRELPVADDAGRRRVRGAAGSDRLPRRVQRIAGRQHGAHRSRHRRDGVDSPAGAARRAARAMELGHAARHVAARSEDHLRRWQQGVPVVESRPDVRSGEPGPHHQRKPRRRGDDGAERQRHHDREERRHPGVADDRVVRRVAEASGNSLRRHRRRQRAGVARYRTLVDERHRQDFRASEGRMGFGGRTVSLRRRNGLRDVRRASAERLRVLHLRQPRLRSVVAVGERESEGRGRQDDHRGREESRRAVRRHRNRTVRVARSREDVDAREGQSADGPHRRDRHPSARQRDDSRHARPRDLDPRSPRTDSGVRGGAGGVG